LKPTLDRDDENAAQAHEERRRHRRFRLSVPVTIRRSDGTVISSMTVEISESGMSVATAVGLQSGEIIEVEPVAGGKASAMVRRCVGNFYGLEFTALSPEQVERINEACRMLPVFHSQSLKI
jgi:hypothetical protein